MMKNPLGCCSIPKTTLRGNHYLLKSIGVLDSIISMKSMTLLTDVVTIY